MTTKFEEKEGYLRPAEMEIFDLRGAGKGVQMTFVHTLDPLRKAVATIPYADLTPQWPMELFMRFNTDYPEAMEHTSELNSYVQRLSV